jgi:translation elongation factor EF-1beta
VRRDFLSPVSAAVVGALLAIGVAAVYRSFDDREHRVRIAPTVDRVDPVDIEIDISEVEAQVAEVIKRMDSVEVVDPKATATVGNVKIVPVRPNPHVERLREGVRSSIEEREDSAAGTSSSSGNGSAPGVPGP